VNGLINIIVSMVPVIRGCEHHVDVLWCEEKVLFLSLDMHGKPGVGNANVCSCALLSSLLI